MSSLIIPSAERNRRDGITGCLWTGQSSFVQVIEGPEDSVQRLMTKIIADPRHHSLKMLMNAPARRRLFETWSLKWVKGEQCGVVDDLADAIVRRLPQGGAAVAAPLTPSRESDATISLAPPPVGHEGTNAGGRTSRMAQIVAALTEAPSATS